MAVLSVSSYKLVPGQARWESKAAKFFCLMWVTETGTSVAIVCGHGIARTTDLFQLTPRAGLPFHTPLIALQHVEVARNWEHCFNEGLGRGRRDVCDLLCERAGDARPVCLYLWHHSVALRLDRKTGEWKKMATCQYVHFKEPKWCPTFISQSLFEKHNLTMKGNGGAAVYMNIMRARCSVKRELPSYRLVRERNFCSWCIFTCLLQRRDPTTPPQFCVNLLARWFSSAPYLPIIESSDTL